MSDDEYYGEYDDFEEGMWDADPAPDLADDLAEHAAYSPVWQDDPVGELESYHSDWEYYSDDYYDDDPVLKNTTLDGSTSAPLSNTSPKTGRRGKKRKLDEVQEPQTIIKKGSLMDCIRGTVWAQQQEEKRVAFQLGQQESVALLKNWREMFKSDSGALHTFGRGQLERDESWANDLSLVDMGLLNDIEKPGIQEKAQMDDEQEGDLIDMEEVDLDLEDLDTTEESEELLETPKFKEHGSDIKDTMDDASNPRKRRRLASLPSPPGSNESNGTTSSEALTKILDTTTDKVRKSNRVDQVVGDTDNASEGVRVASPIHESATHSMKRKLSLATEEFDIPDDTSNKRQAKRTKSAKLAQEQDTSEEKLPTTPRVKRSRLN